MLMKVSTESVRKQNRALVLATIRELGPSSHTDIAEWSGLASATVTAITHDLETEGAIEKAEAQEATTRGRPKRLFNNRAACAYLAAVRIRFDRVEFSLVDYRGTLKDRFTEMRPPEEIDVETFAKNFKVGLERLIERSNIQPGLLRMISITTKGLVAPGRAVLLWSPVFGEGRIDFDALLPDLSGRIVLTNETRFSARAAALSEHKNSTDLPLRKTATLSLGNSVGLGVADHSGAGQISAHAPAFGHMIHQADGPLCRCGASGCVESYAGFYGILRAALEVAPNTIPAKFVPLKEMDRLADQARGGNRMSEYAFRKAGEALGVGVSRLFSLNGAMPINITGDGMRYFDLMQASLEEAVATNLEVRFGEAPDIRLIDDETTLIFDGSVQTMLAHMDNNVIAQGRLESSN